MRPKYTCLRDRLAAELDTSGEHWLWTGAVTQAGYGQFNWHGKHYYAHRAMMEIILDGPIPDGLFVCHHCDIQTCCRPSDIFLGSPLDNSQDCVQKHRHSSHVHPMARGGDKHWSARHPELILRNERHPMVKLTLVHVADMRERYARGDVTQTALAREYGISQSNVSDIVLGRIWT